MSAIAFLSNPELLSGSTWQQNSLKIKINYSKILSLTWIAANIIISSSVQSSSSDISDHLACSYIWLIRTASYCGKKTQKSMKHPSGHKNAHIHKSNTSDGRRFCKEVLWQIQWRRQNRHEKDKHRLPRWKFTHSAAICWPNIFRNQWENINQ